MASYRAAGASLRGCARTSLSRQALDNTASALGESAQFAPAATIRKQRQLPIDMILVRVVETRWTY
jgi:hypothetical protein